MYLLDTPPEIFQHIVHELVSTIGCNKAWKLRAVCRTFAIEIRHDILANRPIAEFPPANFQNVLQPNLGVYLFNRLKKPLDAAQGLLDKIGQMGQYLALELEMDQNAAQESMSALCQATASKLGMSRLLATLHPEDKVWGSWRNPAGILANLRQPLRLSEKLHAAIAVDPRGLVRKLLSVASRDDLVDGDVLGSTISFAISQATMEALEVILEYLESPGIVDYSIADALSGEDHTFACWRTTALRFAIRSQRPEAFKVLVPYYVRYFGPFERKLHGELLSEAINSRSSQMVHLVLQLQVKQGAFVSMNHMLLAASMWTPEVMIEILAAKGMGINKSYKSTSPLIAAIRAGRPYTVKALLQAGADVHMTIGQGSRRKNAMDVAIQARQYRIVQLLLAHGATMPDINTWAGNTPWKKILYSRVQKALARFNKESRMKKGSRGHL